LEVECYQVHYYLCNYWPRVLAPDYDECGAIGGMLGKGKRSTRRKPAPVPLCPPQIPYGLSLGCRGGNLAINRLSYDMAKMNHYWMCWHPPYLLCHTMLSCM
jgi:hypothetical protein